MKSIRINAAQEKESTEIHLKQTPVIYRGFVSSRMSAIQNTNEDHVKATDSVHENVIGKDKSYHRFKTARKKK